MIKRTDEMLRAAQAATECEPAECDECMSKAVEAVLAIVEREQVAPLRTVLEKLLDPYACHYDHHGDCQEHGTTSERPCPHARAKELLATTLTDASGGLS